MGPPEAAAPALCVVTKAGRLLDCGDALGVGFAGARGNVSSERVRKHEDRTIEKEAGMRGSWVEV